MSLFRRHQWNAYSLLAMLFVGSALAGCATIGAPKRTEQIDELAIYSAVIHQIYLEDDTFGGTLQPSTLYLIRHTNDKAGDPTAQSSESILLSQATQSEITTALRDLPTETAWVDTLEDVELDSESGAVADNGAVITLGNIHVQDNGSVQVSASIYVANLAAGGQTYVLEQIDGVWQITGITGPVWMS